MCNHLIEYLAGRLTQRMGRKPAFKRLNDTLCPVQQSVCSIQDTESRFVLGMRVDGTSYEELTQHALAWAGCGESRYDCEAPVHMVMESYDHPEYRRAINEADVVTPGGMPLVWTLRLMGLRQQARVYGPEIMLRVCSMAGERGLPIGLYGANEETIRLLAKSLKERCPGLNLVFSHAPPYRELTAEEDAAIVEHINRSGCRILFVGLGCPKQELWMARHRGKVRALMLGVGAAFDFISGMKRQAPPKVQHLGLEWLFRLATEPRRLWFRYLYHNPRFVVLVLLQFLRLHGRHTAD